MPAVLTDPSTWTALLEIAIINIVLSGDNAVVIALACRSLPPRQQRNAFIVGTAGIVVLMTALTAFAAMLMTLPWLQIIGSVLLLWIGVKLLLPEDAGDSVADNANFWAAVKTIIIADIVMSLDNVLGMAGAAKGHLGMLFVGLLITMPLILFGSALLMKLMERFPAFVTVGAALLGYVAGDMAVGDLAVKDTIQAHAPMLETLVPIAGAAFVVVTGKLLARRHLHRVEAARTAAAHVAESSDAAKAAAAAVVAVPHPSAHEHAAAS
jgi:YjbE family integral membrane protein